MAPSARRSLVRPGSRLQLQYSTVQYSTAFTCCHAGSHGAGNTGTSVSHSQSLGLSLGSARMPAPVTPPLSTTDSYGTVFLSNVNGVRPPRSQWARSQRVPTTNGSEDLSPMTDRQDLTRHARHTADAHLKPAAGVVKPAPRGLAILVPKAPGRRPPRF